MHKLYRTYNREIYSLNYFVLEEILKKITNIEDLNILSVENSMRNQSIKFVVESKTIPSNIPGHDLLHRVLNTKLLDNINSIDFILTDQKLTWTAHLKNMYFKIRRKIWK